jgi:probable HAF family extracellular repeat protein
MQFRHQYFALTLLIWSLFVAAATAQAASYEFFTIDVPDAVDTFAAGINDHGHVVGGYTDQTGALRAFVYEDGIATPIEVPGSRSIIAFGINNRGRIVGSYVTTAQHGFDFLESRRRPLKTIDVPFATDVFLTRANDINNRGQIVGEYLDNTISNQQHGFLNDRGVFTSIDVPNALITSASGINDHGAIVGYYENTAGVHGFVLDGEEYATLDVSFVGATNTLALGINNRGKIVGTYQTSAGIHGFIYSDGTYTTIAVPGALDTTPTGINRSGQVVGFYHDGVGTHGFIATPLPKIGVATNTSPIFQ